MKGALASKSVPFGSKVLARGGRCEPAGDDLANAVAGKPPVWAKGRRRVYRKGEWVPLTLLPGLGQRDLHAIAAGPIMDPSALYLPAGRLSMDEYRAREARIRSGEPA